MPILTFKNCWKHFQTIYTHRKWVKHYCFIAGIPWRGLVHDLSKYSPIEFFESARFYTGTTSPINTAKQEQGVSYGWLHHKGRNSHHYEYWMDNFDDGGYVRLIPLKDFTELICDYLGASHAYNKNKFSFSNEYDWWCTKEKHCAMHPANKAMLDEIFYDFAQLENKHNNRAVEDLIRTDYIKRVYEKYKPTLLTDYKWPIGKILND